MGFIKALLLLLLALLIVVVYFYFQYERKPALNTSPSSTATSATEPSEPPFETSSPMLMTSEPSVSPSSSAAPTPEPNSSPKVTIEDHGVFTKGIDHYNRMDYDKAIVCFKEVTAKNPRNIFSHYQLFLCYVQIEPEAWTRKSNAYKQAKQILALNPDSKMRKQVEAYLKDVASRESTVIEPVAATASPSPKASGTPKVSPSASPSGSPTAAPTPVETAATVAPPQLGLNNGVPTVSSKDADVHYERARNYDKIGNFRFAVAEYTAAVKLNPKHFEAYVSRGSLYESKGDYGNAAGDYTKAISLKPQDAKNYYRRAMLYKQMQDKDKAKADLQKTKEIDPAMSDKVDLILKELESQK